MKALVFKDSIPKYVFLKTIGRLFPRMHYTAPTSMLKMAEIPEPELPSEQWVKIKTSMAGICGSDIGLVFLDDSPSSSVFASFPFVVGHENVGHVVKAGNEVTSATVGDRVVVDPLLPCRVRGITTECPQCAQGEYARCMNFAEGALPPGLMLGVCSAVGGSFSPYFVAHQSQIIRLPSNVTDGTAAVIDSFQSALHPVMRSFPEDSDTVVVYGCGVIGLCVIHALRALGSKSTIVAVARYDYQGSLARKLGANYVLDSEHSVSFRGEASSLLGGRLYKPVLGRPFVVGGADQVFACVGTDRGIDDSLQLVRSGGKLVLIGLAAVPKSVDWTPIWLNEISVHGYLSCSTETYEERKTRTYELAVRLAGERKIDLAPLLTHTFKLQNYRNAITAFVQKRKSRAVKIAFRFDE